MLDRLLAYLRRMSGRRRVNAEVDEELRFHLQQETDALAARGMSAADARRLALRDLGGLQQTREAVRGARTTVVDTVGRDVRHGWRALQRTPTFTAAAIATLALVIGANGAVFSLASALLWRPLPYPEPGALGRVVWEWASAEGQSFGGAVDGRTWELVRDNAHALDVAVASGGLGDRVNFNADDVAAFVSQGRVGAGYFRVLGIAPSLGREFTSDEDRPGGPPVAVLSHSLWREAFRGDPAVLGRTMLLRGEAYEVVGVLPEIFQVPGLHVDVFTPLRPSRSGEGGGTNYQIVARLRPGNTWAEARGEMGSVGTSLNALAKLPEGVSRMLIVRPMRDQLVEGVRTPVYLLLGAGATVFLIACVNLAGLVLARANGRAKEMATRVALGSGRTAIVRQLLVEYLLLGVAGGVVGVGVAHTCLALLQTLGAEIFTSGTRVTLDARTVAVTAIAAFITPLLFGLMPAWQASRVDVNLTFAEGGTRSIAGTSRHWGRRVLIGAEVALSVVLLVATGLLVRTLVHLERLDPGFDPRRVTAASVSLQDARYRSAAAVNQLFEKSIERLERAPQVESAAVSLELPYSRLLNYPFQLEHRPADKPRIANFMYVTPRFFDTLRIPVRRGRSLAMADRAGQPPVVVVNEAFVRVIAEGEDPIGRRLSLNKKSVEIVGIVGNVQTRDAGFSLPGMVRGPLMTPPIVFFPAAQMDDAFADLVHRWFSPYWTVRTAQGVNAGALLHSAINSADPLLPVTPAVSLGEVTASATSFQRLLFTLIGTCALAALLLAAIGIYGLIAQSVHERTRELGIRMALGATSRQVIRGVVRGGVVTAAAGVIVGIALAWMAVRLIAAFLWGVNEHDPATFAAITLVLFAVATLASVVPALRILRIDPAKTLKV